MSTNVYHYYSGYYRGSGGGRGGSRGCGVVAVVAV